MAKPTIIIRRRREDSEGPTVIRLPPKQKPRVVVMERKTEPTVVYRRDYNTRPMTGGEIAILGLVAVGVIGLVAFSIWLAAQEQVLYDDGDVIIIE